MAVLANIRTVTESVMRFAEARIIRAAQHHIDGRTVAIGGNEITQRIEHETEGVHLTPGELLDAGAIGFHPVKVAGIHRYGMAIGTLERGIVPVTVAGVKPAIIAATESARQTVGVEVVALSAVKHFAFVRATVAVGVREAIGVGNAERNRA